MSLRAKNRTLICCVRLVCRVFQWCPLLSLDLFDFRMTVRSRVRTKAFVHLDLTRIHCWRRYLERGRRRLNTRVNLFTAVGKDWAIYWFGWFTCDNCDDKWEGACHIVAIRSLWQRIREMMLPKHGFIWIWIVWDLMAPPQESFSCQLEICQGICLCFFFFLANLCFTLINSLSFSWAMTLKLCLKWRRIRADTQFI